MVSAHDLRCEVAGAGEPVLLIHGSLIADSFLPFMGLPVLTDRFRLIRYRRRGFTGSAPSQGRVDIATHVLDAAGLLADLGAERAHVVGHSTGGTVAAQLALDHPGVVRSVVLLEPVVSFTDEEAKAFAEVLAPFEEVYRGGNAALAADLFLSGGGVTDWRAEIHTTVPGGEEQALRDAATFFESDLPELRQHTFPDATGGLSQPVLHISAGDSPFESSNAVGRLAPSFADVEIADVGHGLQMVRPVEVAEVIADFLNRHPMT